jgi:hypothetical protein
MANTFTPTDVYGIVNAMSKEMWGANSTLTAFDTSSFTTVGEAMLRTGYENTLNALGAVIGKTIIAARPYRGKFKIIMRTPDEFGLITRKISYYSTALEPSEDWNTDINATQLVDGASVDPWKISKVYPLQVVFAGIKVSQKSYTRFLYQLKGAFVSPEAFAAYIAGILVEIGNDIEVDMDAENRLQVLNAIGATYNVGAPRQKVNLTAEYNAFYGTSYTTAQLLTTYYKEFIEFFVMRLKGDMELMAEFNSLFHIYPAKNNDAGNALTLNRHTPAEARRLLLYMPRIRQAESTVFPALFDNSYLRLSDYESVEYWQNPNDPEAVDIVPNQLDVSTGQSANGNRVQLAHVLALLFDRDALATSVKVEEVLSTDINPRGSYINQVWHWAKSHNFDQTENMILYYMAD